ncbi:DeoR/GlpR transcriptional regulator [Clostridium sp. D2Q-14]|uniref:DeoR/GlpR family DNA-binding transcription regulator n=1 Tax=Anaeromonas gelatinilytica TaxID=2683194 RepID=UPI00193C6BEC|nr:DeoR/GlpR family DNA-binding transcription regulator [Anaeromonas gelatinilytica]MBS4535757.1 DeoR/GlpR transcriptional regulator [Anaeromonas gelatinilytica]
MLKKDRQKRILQLIDETNFLKVSDASNILKVAEMTIRRDFKELEAEGEIERIHGGAKKKKNIKSEYIELSHRQKKLLNISEKKYVAKKAAELINDNDVVFIGAGTTTEYMYDYINVGSAKIITNSISIFNRFKSDSKFDLILTGGKLRERTGTFVGYFTQKWIKDIKVQKVFIGTNGIKDENITTAEEEEGVVQQVILNNSHENYVLADSTKFGIEAFQVLCNISEITAIITDDKLSSQVEEFYDGKVKIIK